VPDVAGGAAEPGGARIRPYEPADLDGLYRVCLQTADSGEDATALFSDPMLPGHVFAAPYAIFEPSLAWVAEDAAGVAGYVLGALDTPEFQDRLERDWWPALRARYPDPRQLTSTLPEWERVTLQAIHRPFTGDPELVSRYPSHLHIDLLPRLQGSGLGRRMMETLLAALRAGGSRGVHLHVSRANERAAGFYRHVGLIELPATGARVFAMTLADTSAGRLSPDCSQRGADRGDDHPAERDRDQRHEEAGAEEPPADPGKRQEFECDHREREQHR
jgi:ribosomal protein S18 acetylase RimI-like enzyme